VALERAPDSSRPVITNRLQSEHRTTGQRKLFVSVVVPTRDRNADLERCLAATNRLKPAVDEILVVDSAPRTGSARDVALRWHACYVREDVPGASRARNRGAREACGDIVIYTDDDAVPDEGWLRPILSEFDDPRVALVVGKVLPPPAQPDLYRLYELAGFTGQGNDRIIVDRDTPGWFEKVNFLPFGIAPNLAIRRSAFQEWQGFDERLGPGTLVPGHEEQHAFLQLIDLGFRLVYTPAASVTHPFPARSAQELQLRIMHRMQASSAYLTLLMVEEPQHRGDVLRYIIRKLRHEANRHFEADRIQIHGLRRFFARLQGPGLYYKSR
jgi:GT2 family glycosyltransferase